MRVFVAFGYRKQERRVVDLVIPILRSFEITILDGRELPGSEITEEVRRRIASSDALIGFLLKRQPNPNGRWSTSDYVRQEVETALGLGKDVIQVLESGVAAPGGKLKILQRLSYDPQDKAAFLVKFTEHIRDWVRGIVYVRLAPDALVQALDRPEAQRHRFCDYEIVSDGQLARSGRAPVLGLGGGLYVKLTGFSPGSHANLTVEAAGQRWSCTGVPHIQPFVTMQLAAIPTQHVSTIPSSQ